MWLHMSGSKLWVWCLLTLPTHNVTCPSQLLRCARLECKLDRCVNIILNLSHPHLSLTLQICTLVWAVFLLYYDPAVPVGSSMGQVPVTQAQIGLPLELGPPGAQILASGLEQWIWWWLRWGRSLQQAQLGANPAREDTLSSLAFPLQFSSPWIPDVSARFWISERWDGYHCVGPCNTGSDVRWHFARVLLGPRCHKIMEQLGDDCHGAGPCDADPGGHQLCQCTCRYVSVPVLSTRRCATGKVVNQSSLQRGQLHHLWRSWRINGTS